MNTCHIVVAVCLIAAAAIEAQRVFPQPGALDCSRVGKGLIPDQSNCSRFYDCSGGQAVLMSCLRGLNFDPNGRNGQGACDYPARITPTPNCVDTNEETIRAELRDTCRPEPTDNPEWAFTRAHPTICNSLYICAPNYIYGPCVFCAEGTYANRTSNRCDPIDKYIAQDPKDPNPPLSACPDGSQRRIVAQKDIVLETTGLECSIHTDYGV